MHLFEKIFNHQILSRLEDSGTFMVTSHERAWLKTMLEHPAAADAFTADTLAKLAPTMKELTPVVGPVIKDIAAGMIGALGKEAQLALVQSVPSLVGALAGQAAEKTKKTAKAVVLAPVTIPMSVASWAARKGAQALFGDDE